MIRALCFCLILLSSLPALAQEESSAQSCLSNGGVCVDIADLDAFLQIAKAHQCRAETKPAVTADSLTIIVDRQGRVYGSGTGSKPFNVKLDWCNYQLSLESQIRLVVAKRVEPEWGFRLRLKAAFGALVSPAVKGEKLYKSLEAGLALEPFYVRIFNVNLIVAVHSVGLGLGVDLTDNFGVLLGGTAAYGSWDLSPLLAATFAF